MIKLQADHNRCISTPWPSHRHSLYIHTEVEKHCPHFPNESNYGEAVHAPEPECTTQTWLENNNATVFTSQTRMCPSVPPVSRRLRSELNLTTFWSGSWGFRSDCTSAKPVTEMWAVSSLISDISPDAAAPSCPPLSPFPARRLALPCCTLFPTAQMTLIFTG